MPSELVFMSNQNDIWLPSAIVSFDFSIHGREMLFIGLLREYNNLRRLQMMRHVWGLKKKR